MSTQDRKTGSDDFIYDPDQDPEEKRQIRDGYRDKLKDIEERGKDLKRLDFDVLTEGLRNAERSFDGVRAPEEAVLDSRLLTAVSALSALKAKQLRHDGGGFDVDEFVHRMVHFLGGDRIELPEDDEEDSVVLDFELDWAKLGVQILGSSRRVPGADFMYGPLGLEVKKRTVRRQARAEKVREDEKSKPKEVTAEELEQKDKVDVDFVKELGRFIEEQDGPINVFKLCMNPESFGQSVENLFYLSFLIHDARVAVEINDDNEFVVYACELPTAHDYQEGMRKGQGVWQLDESLWKRAIEKYNITEPMFPTRAVPPEHTTRFYG